MTGGDEARVRAAGGGEPLHHRRAALPAHLAAGRGLLGELRPPLGGGAGARQRAGAAPARWTSASASGARRRSRPSASRWPCWRELARDGYRLGIATNDAEASALAQADAHGPRCRISTSSPAMTAAMAASRSPAWCWPSPDKLGVDAGRGRARRRQHARSARRARGRRGGHRRAHRPRAAATNWSRTPTMWSRPSRICPSCCAA